METNNRSENPTGKNKDRRFYAAIFVLLASLVVLVSGIIVIGKILWNYSDNKQTEVPGPPPQALDVAPTTTPDPVLLSIPSLKITAPFVGLGLNTDQTIEVPKTDDEVGWFKYGTKPGDIGPAVVVGHLDSAKGPAIFANLNNIKPGDKIIITRADSSVVSYTVNSSSKYSQNNFPTDLVYGQIPYAGLRLITCAGVYSKKVGHYSDNLIVFARLDAGGN